MGLPLKSRRFSYRSKVILSSDGDILIHGSRPTSSNVGQGRKHVVHNGNMGIAVEKAPESVTVQNFFIFSDNNPPS